MTRVPAEPPTDVDQLKAEIADLRDQVQFLRVANATEETWLSYIRNRLKLKRRLRQALRRSGLRRGAGGGEKVASISPYQVRPIVHVSEPRLRVLHALAHVGLGGSGRIIVDLMERLPDVEHMVITARDPEVTAYVGLPAYQVGHAWDGRPIRSLIRTTRPSIVHVHYVAGDPRESWGEADWRWYHQVFTAARDEGCPVIENVNIPVPPYVSEVVHSYVHVSMDVAARFDSGTGKDTVIYPGSDTEFFRMPPGSQLADDSLGMVYRLQREKLDDSSIDPLIKAVRQRQGTRGLVVGGGELLPVFRAAAAEAGVADRMDFPGYVPYEALVEWYGRLGVFVAPVIQESFGQVVPFAMSMGIPVVGYRIGALPEIIGDPDLLVPAGDSNGMARLVVELLDDRKKRLEIGQRNRARAIERFSLPAMVRSYRVLYDRVAASNPTSRSGRPVGVEAGESR